MAVEERVTHVESRLKELGLPAVSQNQAQFDLDSGRLQIVNTFLMKGLPFPHCAWLCVGERICSQRPKKKRFRRREGVNLQDYRELNVGDYVVHEQHSIGKYLGLKTLEVSGVQKITCWLNIAERISCIPVEQIN